MNNHLKTVFLVYALLTSRVGHSQLIKISAEGFQRWSLLSNSVAVSGPMQVSTLEKHYAYGLRLSYELGKNGIEAGISTYPYRLDLRFKSFLNTQVNPSNIVLFSLLYRRNILFIERYGINAYVSGGLGVGKYKNDKITEGIGTVSLNGTTIYMGHLDRASTYDRSSILIPAVKLEIEKSLSNHFIASAYSAYFFKNWFGYSKAIESGTYSYSYYQNSGSGKLSDYGEGPLIGISLKYQIHL